MIHLNDCGKNEFADIVSSKKVFCFGAGKQFNKFVVKNPNIRISGVIDNYKCRDESKIEAGNMIINIYSVEQFAQIYDETCVVVITCLMYEEIIAQLDQISELDGLECYLDLFLEQYTEHFNWCPVPKNNKQIIPKKIHYCWFGGGELPDEYKKYIESWRKCCPDYEIIRWDESNYDVTKNRYMRQAYENKKWAFVSDYARVDIIYHQGGIYLDTDVELVKNFDEFLKWDLFCGFESFDYVSWGVGFGAVKEHEILKDVLNEYEKRSFLKEDGSFDLTGCPILQSEVMKRYGFVMNGQPQSINNIAIYPIEYFAPFSYLRGFGRITENTHSIHHYSASWVDGVAHSNFQRWESLVDLVKRHGSSRQTDGNYNKRNEMSDIKRFQIWDRIAETDTAGSKAPCDVKNIAGEMGYQVINIHPIRGEYGTDTRAWSTRQNEEDWKKCYESIPENSILLLQHPFWQRQEEREKEIINLKRKKKVKIISFVHDVEKLRGMYVDDNMQHEFDFMLQNADIFIVHNARMAVFFEENGIKRDKIVILGIFDYLSKNIVNNKKFESSMIVAGNLDSRKSGYISKLPELSGIKIDLYGPNYTEHLNDSKIKYHGSFPMEQIAEQLYGGFGLVWDGNVLETCTGPNGNYLRYNNPHKLSLYLASGIPVFIWSEAAEAEFVKEHGVGVTISSLYNVPQILQNMTKERYNQYLMAVNEIAGQLREGKYTRQALEKSEKIILEEIDDGRL